MSEEVIECDLVVVGAGMAGLSAAGRAAENGARVVVIEKAPHIGGSAIMSGGILWTASSAEKMELYGGGDPVLGEVVRSHYPAAVAWLKKRGNQVSRAMKVLHGYGYQINVVRHLNDCRDAVERGAAMLCTKHRLLDFFEDAWEGSLGCARTTQVEVSMSSRRRRY
jgi:flavin-dependent dehydrogenase